MFDTIDTGTSGQLTLLQEIGRGGMAVVYLARLEGTGGFKKLVAVKVIELGQAGLSRELGQWLVNEARLGGLLQHDHIVQTLFFGQNDRLAYLGMEFVDGPSLREVLGLLKAQQQLMPPDVAVQIFEQLCDGMSAAHVATDDMGRPLKLIHRDMKPSNLMFTSGGTLKICDFGIARAETNAEITRFSGVIKGTVRYMSPEQAYGNLHLDHRADLFAMALILFEMLSGIALYAAETVGLQLRLAQDADVESRLQRLPADLPEREAFLDFFRHALQREPSERFQSAPEMVAALEEILERLPSRTSLKRWLQPYIQHKQRFEQSRRSASNPGLSNGSSETPLSDDPNGNRDGSEVDLGSVVWSNPTLNPETESGVVDLAAMSAEEGLSGLSAPRAAAFGGLRPSSVPSLNVLPLAPAVEALASPFVAPGEAPAQAPASVPAQTEMSDPDIGIRPAAPEAVQAATETEAVAPTVQEPLPPVPARVRPSVVPGETPPVPPRASAPRQEVAELAPRVVDSAADTTAEATAVGEAVAPSRFPLLAAAVLLLMGLGAGLWWMAGQNAQPEPVQTSLDALSAPVATPPAMDATPPVKAVNARKARANARAERSDEAEGEEAAARKAARNASQSAQKATQAATATQPAPVPQSTTLTLRTNGSDAVVYLDGVRLREKMPLTGREIAEGPHSLRFVSPIGEEISRSIFVPAGKSVSCVADFQVYPSEVVCR